MLPDVLSHELYCIYDGGTENLMLKGKSLQVIIQVFYFGGGGCRLYSFMWLFWMAEILLCSRARI